MCEQVNNRSWGTPFDVKNCVIDGKQPTTYLQCLVSLFWASQGRNLVDSLPWWWYKLFVTNTSAVKNANPHWFDSLFAHFCFLTTIRIVNELFLAFPLCLRVVFYNPDCITYHHRREKSDVLHSSIKKMKVNLFMNVLLLNFAVFKQQVFICIRQFFS